MSNTESAEDFVRTALQSIVADLPADFPFGARFDELGVDSMSLMDLVLHIESTWGVAIPDDELAALRSPSVVADYLVRSGVGEAR